MPQITPKPRLRLPRGSGLAFICALILSCVLMVIYALPLAPGGPIDALSQSDQSAASPQSSDSQTQDKPQPFKPRTLSVVMSGDLLWHSGLWDSAAQVAYETGRGPYDFSVLFGPIRSTIESADLAICHEEVPLARRCRTERLSRFRSPSGSGRSHRRNRVGPVHDLFEPFTRSRIRRH